MEKAEIDAWLAKHGASLGPKPIPDEKRIPQGMRLWTMTRINDQSGVSGTGEVVQGAEFATGEIAYQWLAGPDPDVQTKKSMDSFLSVHVHSHPENITIITYDDGEQYIYPTPKEKPKE